MAVLVLPSKRGSCQLGVAVVQMIYSYLENNLFLGKVDASDRSSSDLLHSVDGPFLLAVQF